MDKIEIIRRILSELGIFVSDDRVASLLKVRKDLLEEIKCMIDDMVERINILEDEIENL